MELPKPKFPDVDFDEFMAQPRGTRLRMLCQFWVENGFGLPITMPLLYVVKIGVYIVGTAAVISLTPGLGGLGEIGHWWGQPIVYQKLVVFTLLWEFIGFGCGFGPLTGRFIPPMGAIVYWLRPGTIRLPPWPDKVPFTKGDERSILDVALYAIVLISGACVLLSAGQRGPVSPDGDVGLLDPALVIPVIVGVALLGLRDKTMFLAARGEHYWLTLFVFFFPFTDQIIGFKLVLLGLWWGAATSKLNRHFPYVIQVMVSNSPAVRAKWLKRLMYRDPVSDLRPTWIPKLLAHGVGMVSEFLVPLYLVFFTDGGWLTWVAVGYMVAFHLFILSTIPMGVPMEWNVFIIFSLFYLFGHYPTITVYDLGSPLMLLILIVGLAVVPIVGNLYPQLVSFLPSMRYYAGNWATSVWAFRAGAEEKLDTHVKKASAVIPNQLATLYDRETGAKFMEYISAWRSMHSHGRALNGLIPRAVDDEAQYAFRDGELVAGPLIGWNFGDGHLHNEQLIAAVQRRCNFAEGELRVVILESQPIHKQHQAYRIVDAKTGLVEAGYVAVRDMFARQPWPEPGNRFPVYRTAKVAAADHPSKTQLTKTIHTEGCCPTDPGEARG